MPSFPTQIVSLTEHNKVSQSTDAMSGLEDDHGEPPDKVHSGIHALPVGDLEAVHVEVGLVVEEEDEVSREIGDLCEDLIRLVEQKTADDDDNEKDWVVESLLLPTSEDVPDDILQSSTPDLKVEAAVDDLVTPKQVDDQLNVSPISITANSSSNLKKTVGSVLKSNVDTVSEIIAYVVKSSLAYNNSTSKCSKVGSSRKKRCLSPCQDKSVKKLKVESLAEESRKTKLKWAPGDIVWFKVREQPYWPGKISYDTEMKEYVRHKGKGCVREYYVTPFGRNTSGRWIIAPQILKFQGRVQYEKHVSFLINRLSDVCQKQQMAKFGIKECQREEWEKVVCRVENSCLKEDSNANTNQLKRIIRKRTNKRNVQKMTVEPLENSKNKQVACKKQKVLKTSPEIPLSPSLSSTTVNQIKKKVPKQVNGELLNTSSSQLNSDGISSEKHRKGKKPEECPKSLTEDETLVIAKKKRQRKRLEGTKNGQQTQPEITGTEIIKKDDEDPLGESKAAVENLPGAEEKVSKPSSEKSVDTAIKEPKKIVNGRMSGTTSSTKGEKPKKKHFNRSSCSDSINSSGDSDSTTDIKKEGILESKRDKICQTCEQLVTVIEDCVRCTGDCNCVFHKACLKSPLESQDLETYKCDLCINGIHICFVCKKSDGEMRRCNTRMCGKYYHLSCLSAFCSARTDGNSIMCSLHSCLSCCLARTRKVKPKLVRCLRCPIAYHATDECLAAGSLFLSSQYILCPRHYDPSKKPRKVAHVNVNWCFMCSTGGSLICCETCPASFHAECLRIEPPEDSYYCLECLAGTQPTYGDIVWAKLGTFRWWPAKIYNPKNVPPNIRSIPHQPGEFPVRFFGTHDYYWTSRSRVFQFQEGDQGAQYDPGNKLAKIYERALNEASVAYHEWKSAKECRAALDYERIMLQPPRYRFIKKNMPVGKVTIFTADPSQMTPCDCNPESEAPCGSDSDCLNRMLMFECHPAVCPAGERCLNQRFEKRQYVPAEVFRAEGKGWGLRSMVDVKKGEFVNEYVGELIDEEECRRRMNKMHEENKTSYYFLTIDKDRIIDAADKGNLSRFMNHSCQPNCETHKWTVNGDTRVGLFAVCDIPAGTELTFNYNLDCLGNEKTKCKCQAPNCSGFIGERPKQNNAISSKKSDKGNIARKKKRKPRIKNEHEDECYRCGLEGELLMCDRRTCPKAYHLSCLDLDKPPYGRWECPWHHCDICGKAASALCMMCPNSFCKDHLNDNIFHMSNGTPYCNDHTAEEATAYFSECAANQDVPSASSSTSSSSKLASKKKKKVTSSTAKSNPTCDLPEKAADVLPNCKGSAEKQSSRPVHKKSLSHSRRIPNGRKLARTKSPRSQKCNSKSTKPRSNLVKKSKHDRLLNGTKTKHKDSSKEMSVSKTTSNDNNNLLKSKPMNTLALQQSNDSVNSVIDSVVEAAASFADRQKAATKKTTLNGKMKHLRIKPLIVDRKKKNCNLNGVLVLNKVNGRVFKKKLRCDCDVVSKTVRRTKPVKQLPPPPQQQQEHRGSPVRTDNFGGDLKTGSDDSKPTSFVDSSVPNCAL